MKLHILMHPTSKTYLTCI